MNIAMWSGPRNVSTAMMRSWEARGDCAVTDEPLYGHYLSTTGISHPGAYEIMESQSCNASDVTRWLKGPAPDGKVNWFQKHMCHHLLPFMDDGWLNDLEHFFLIRDPVSVLTSYVKTRTTVTLQDLGFADQTRIFDRVCSLKGSAPPVVDSVDLLKDPRGTLIKLCDRLGLEFTDRMLSWKLGLRDSDGCWAKYWYASVATSDSFKPYSVKSRDVPIEHADLEREAQVHYQRLYAYRNI
jgi:hypothetical protein